MLLPATYPISAHLSCILRTHNVWLADGDATRRVRATLRAAIDIAAGPARQRKTMLNTKLNINSKLSRPSP